MEEDDDNHLLSSDRDNCLVLTAREVFRLYWIMLNGLRKANSALMVLGFVVST